MEEKILSCPFCNSEDIRLNGSRTYSSMGKDLWSIRCHDCGATFVNRFHKYLAIAAWNKRYNETTQYDEGEILEKIKENKRWRRYAPYMGWDGETQERRNQILKGEDDGRK